MVRFMGLNFPEEKRVSVALTAIYGVGQWQAQKLCAKLGWTEALRVRELRPFHWSRLSQALEQQAADPSAAFKIENDLRKETRENIRRLMDLRCYRGIRHQMGLSVHGQRTKTNSKTQKKMKKPRA